MSIFYIISFIELDGKRFRGRPYKAFYTKATRLCLLDETIWTHELSPTVVSPTTSNGENTSSRVYINPEAFASESVQNQYKKMLDQHNMDSNFFNQLMYSTSPDGHSTSPDGLAKSQHQGSQAVVWYRHILITLTLACCRLLNNPMCV